MRPNDSALNTLQHSKSPLGALIVHGLLLGFCASFLAAQTRLDSNQIAPLKGDVKGPFSDTVLRDYNSAVDHGNGVTNAIYSAIADCGAVSNCLIMVPSYYGTGEATPGYQLNYNTPTAGATTPANIAIFDRRYGDARMFVNNNGLSYGLLNSPESWIYDYYSKASQNARLTPLDLRQWSIDGGNNQANSALSYSDKTTWATFLASDISHTPAQHESALLSSQNTSIGNTMGINNLVTCYGGYNAQGDRGCRAVDNSVLEGTVEYAGTLSGSPFAGTTSLSVSPTQGQYTQGSGRFLVKTNAGTISTGTISAIANNYPVIVTGSGTAWPVSTMIGQLGTNITGPGTASVTPANFTAGSLSSLSTTSLVCVADQESFEMLSPTAVTATTFTANFAKIHPSNAIISAGGACGYLLDLTADEVTNSTLPAKTQTITGTLHFAYPMIASTSSSSASVWVTAGGGWQPIVSRWNATTANGYVLYPFAEVVSTQQAGGLSNNLTVGPNNVSWTSGDSVSEFLYASAHYSMGNTIVESYYPNITNVNAFGLTYNVPLQGGEAMMSLVNNTPQSFYSSGGGTYFPPHGITLGGPTAKTITVDLPPDNAAIGVGCLSPCNSTSAVLAAGNGSYYDFLTYDQGNQHWNLSTNNNNTHYYLAGSIFATPFYNFWMGSDSNSQGYIATREARTNTSLNSDFSGELAFSTSSSASWSLQGTYASHPECVARPQFDTGATNRFWITYGASSVTVTFASPVTGIVTYSCSGRN